MRRFLLCLAIAGCARAGKENTIVGGLDDAGSRGDGLDASPSQTTLTQTTSSAIVAGNSFRCPLGPNSYYRVFTLADHGITATLHVTQVDFAIQDAIAGNGGINQPAIVRIGTYTGALGNTTLDLVQIHVISSADIQIPSGQATTMTVPITADIAPAERAIVELAIPDPATTGNSFLAGTNTDGESHPAYTLEPRCSHPSPTTMQSIADANMFGNVDLVLTLTGTTNTPN